MLQIWSRNLFVFLKSCQYFWITCNKMRAFNQNDAMCAVVAQASIRCLHVRWSFHKYTYLAIWKKLHVFVLYLIIHKLMQKKKTDPFTSRQERQMLWNLFLICETDLLETWLWNAFFNMNHFNRNTINHQNSVVT